ncbi:uncharacterized protein LOC110048998 isoform X2 [Orbicella faveolata]|nr:uncharacterized protein LOC110048998 isoform X2 [Orbicella faveolata]
MEDIASFSPEQKSTYLLKRKRVGVLAATKWKGIPKFNSPTMKAELVSFAAEVAPQCAMPEVGFNEEGIMKHVQAYFNEQRRYRSHKSDSKGKCRLTEDSNLPELPTAKSDSAGHDSDMTSKSKRFKASQK